MGNELKATNLKRRTGDEFIDLSGNQAIEGMATKFYSKINVNIIKKMTCHVINNDFMSGNLNVVKVSKSSKVTEHQNFQFY